jgi:hypothetical protein
MKRLYLAALLAIGMLRLASGQDAGFGGLQKAMDPDTYERSGLGTLTSEQRAVIDDFVRGYVAGKQKTAATTAAAEAVERAVKEQKVRPPDVTESRIVGTFNGYGPRTFFHLENGQVWRPVNDDVVKFPPTQNPSVVIYRSVLGFKMFIERASVVHVRRVQ